MFCEKSGMDLESETKACTNCGATVSDARKTSSSVKKTSKRKLKPFIMVTVIALVVIFAISNFAYAKNAVMKMLMTPEEYLAYVVSSGSEEFFDTFTENLETAKGYVEEGIGTSTKAEFKKYDGLESVLFDAGFDDAAEFVEWIRNIILSLDVNHKDDLIGAGIGVELNDIDLGEVNAAVDMKEMMAYYGTPEYGPKYFSKKLDNDNGDGGKCVEFVKKANKVIGAMPNKEEAGTLLTKYLTVVLNSIEEVGQEEKLISADEVCQNVTKLTVEFDEKEAKNFTVNFLKEVKDDKELRTILDSVVEATGKDVLVFWDNVNDVIANEGGLNTDIAFDILVNGNGEIAGFTVVAEEVTVETYVAEAGNKFGYFFEVDTGDDRLCLEGSGKKFGNKISGEFDLSVMGIHILDIEITDLDIKRLKEGFFDGRITVECTEEFEDVRFDKFGIDSDVIETLSLLKFTIKSSQKAVDKWAWKIYFEYDEEAVLEFEVKGGTEDFEVVKVPTDYIDVNNQAEVQEWAKSFEFDKIIEKLDEAKLTDEYVDWLEEKVETNFR